MKTLKELREKSVSQAQQKMMGMALAYKRGEMDDASPEVKKMADSMSMKDLEDFAKTKHKGLPVKKESVELDEVKKDKDSPVYHIVTQGEGDNKQKVVGVYDDVKKATAARDAWNKKNNPAKPSHRARVYSQKPYWNNEKPKVGSAISWSTYSNKDNYTKIKEEVELDEWKKDSGWKKSSGERKDRFGNVIKTKNVAKNLAKSAQKKTAKMSEELDEAPKLKTNSGPWTKAQIQQAMKSTKTDIAVANRIMSALRDM